MRERLNTAVQRNSMGCGFAWVVPSPALEVEEAIDTTLLFSS